MPGPRSLLGRGYVQGVGKQMRQIYWEGVGIPEGGRCTRRQGAGMPEGAGIPEGWVTQEQGDGSGRVRTYTHPLNMGPGYLPLPLPPPRHGTWDTHLEYWHLVAVTTACMAGKRAITILLECSSLITVFRHQFRRGNISSCCQIQQVSKKIMFHRPIIFVGKPRGTSSITYPGGNRRLQHQTGMLIQSGWYGDNPTATSHFHGN